VTEPHVSRRKPFIVGVLLGVILGMALGSALAAVFGDDVSVLVRRLIKRIAGEKEQPNLQILLQ
jgi:putative Ca2+/H+ antiporter (TMEM165/GDT1 family)